MGWGIIRKIPAVIIRPIAAFREISGESPFHALLYFGLLFLFYIILSFIAFALQFVSLGVSQNIPSDLPILLLPHAMIQMLLLIYLAIYIVWIHVWVFALGGRKDFGQTVKSILYGLTPLLLLGYLSQIFLVAGFWSLALIALGIRELQGISIGRAIVATVIPTALFVISILVLFFALVL